MLLAAAAAAAPIPSGAGARWAAAEGAAKKKAPSPKGERDQPTTSLQDKKAGDPRRAKLGKKLQRPLNFFPEPERRERPADNQPAG